MKDESKIEFLITVIIPTYNRAELISKAIESVRNQTHKHWELIVVDDGSMDKTEEIVSKYCTDPRITFIKRSPEQQKGANTCRNIGLRVSRGFYIKWLDSDDYLDPHCLEKQLEKIANSDADVCFCQTRFFEEDGYGNIKSGALWCKYLFTDNIVQSLVHGELRWQTMSGLWRKAYLPAKPFHEGLMNAQEWLFHIQASLEKTKYCFLDEVLCYIRVHSGSMSSRSAKRGKYYYNSCYAFFLAIDSLSKIKPEKYRAMIGHLLKKFAWYHLFTFYKGGYREFMRLFKFYPKMFFRLNH